MKIANWRDVAVLVLRCWWWLTKPVTIGVRGIIPDEKGRVLLVQHDYGRRRWFLPGGGRRRDESPDETLVREIREETGLQVAIDHLVGVYYSSAEFKRDHIFVFACRILEGTLRWEEGEIAASDWFDPQELPETVVPGTGEVLRCWQQGRVGYGRWPWS